MIETIKDEEDRCIAYCEWTLVNDEGTNTDLGEYCYIRDLWIHKDYRWRVRIIRKFIEEITNKVLRINPLAKYVYWQRKKYCDRLKLFTKEQITKEKLNEQSRCFSPTTITTPSTINC